MGEFGVSTGDGCCRLEAEHSAGRGPIGLRRLRMLARPDFEHNVIADIHVFDDRTISQVRRLVIGLYCHHKIVLIGFYDIEDDLI